MIQLNLVQPEPTRQTPPVPDEPPKPESTTAEPKQQATDDRRESDQPQDAEPQGVEQQVIALLKEVYDPEIPVNIYDLGLIYGVKEKPEGSIKVTMTLTAPNCPAAQTLPAEVKDKAESVEGVESADVEVVFDPPWNPDKMSDAAKLALNIL